MKNITLKTISQVSFSFIFLLGILGCKEEQISELSDELEQNVVEHNYSFSEVEVNDLLMENFGTVDLTFEQISTFLSQVIIEKFSSELEKDEAYARMLSLETCNDPYTHVQLSAGLYYNGSWDFKTMTGNINGFHYLNNSDQIPPSNQSVGASISVWRGFSSYMCELYWVQTESPLSYNCSPDNIRATARNVWNNGLTQSSYVSVKCDN